MKHLLVISLVASALLFSCKSSFESSKTRSWSKGKVHWNSLSNSNDQKVESDLLRPKSRIQKEISKVIQTSKSKPTQEIVLGESDMVVIQEMQDIANLQIPLPPDTNRMQNDSLRRVEESMSPEELENQRRKKGIANYAEAEAKTAKLYGIIGTLGLFIPFVGWGIGLIFLILGTTRYFRAANAPYNTRKGADDLLSAKIWLIVGWVPYAITILILLAILVFFIGAELGYW